MFHVSKLKLAHSTIQKCISGIVLLRDDKTSNSRRQCQNIEKKMDGNKNFLENYFLLKELIIYMY